jgi:hypothetical protein
MVASCGASMVVPTESVGMPLYSVSTSTSTRAAPAALEMNSIRSVSAVPSRATCVTRTASSPPGSIVRSTLPEGSTENSLPAVVTSMAPTTSGMLPVERMRRLRSVGTPIREPPKFRRYGATQPSGVQISMPARSPPPSGGGGPAVRGALGLAHAGDTHEAVGAAGDAVAEHGAHAAAVGGGGPAVRGALGLAHAGDTHEAVGAAGDAVAEHGAHGGAGVGHVAQRSASGAPRRSCSHRRGGRACSRWTVTCPGRRSDRPRSRARSTAARYGCRWRAGPRRYTR